MKARVFLDSIICQCGQVMYVAAHEGTVECYNVNCEHHGKKYERPVREIDLVEIKD